MSVCESDLINSSVILSWRVKNKLLLKESACAAEDGAFLSHGLAEKWVRDVYCFNKKEAW